MCGAWGPASRQPLLWCLQRFLDRMRQNKDRPLSDLQALAHMAMLKCIEYSKFALDIAKHMSEPPASPQLADVVCLCHVCICRHY